MTDYSPHYAILGITRETDWAALRACYRRLIGQWHPDRFPADSTERALAEERSKQITSAYRALELYYRGNGVLPPLQAVKTAERPTRNIDPAPESPREAAEAAAPAATQRPAAMMMTGRRRALATISALALGAYFAYYVVKYQAGADDAATSDASDAVEGSKTSPQDAGIPRGTSGITVGSTLGEVYAIHGVPTTIQGDTWFYGKSSIRFEQGKAVSWTQHPDNPLRIARDQPVERLEGMFYVGSTKDEVRSIQGTPVSETEKVWDYGPSRVYFEHNRVVRWETSPLQPLHVPR